MNKPTLSQLLTGVTLPTALVVEVFFATAAVQATPVARADSPQAVVRVFFDALQSTDPKIVNPEFRRRYFTNSFNQYQFQEKIVGAFANTTLTFGEPITIDSRNVIVKVNVSEDDQREDMVVFLKQEPTWKVDAIRSLARPGFVYQMRKLLNAKSDLSPEEQWQKQDINRLFATDEELIEKYRQTQAQFTEIGKLFSSQNQLNIVCRLGFNQYRINENVVQTSEIEGVLHRNGIDRNTFDRYIAALEQLDVSCIQKDEDNILFVKGGITDDSLGYMYAPIGKVPPISKSEYFYIEKIYEQWYIYRTT